MKYPQRFFHRARVNVPVDVAWDVFTNHERLGEYTASECRIIKNGSPERNGLGCVRALSFEEERLGVIEEEINYWHPNKLFGFRVVSGTSVTHHQGIVRFFPVSDSESEWVHDLRLIAADEVLEAMPNFYDVAIDEFRAHMRDAESECERRGSPVGVNVPIEPIPLSAYGGQLE